MTRSRDLLLTCLVYCVCVTSMLAMLKCFTCKHAMCLSAWCSCLSYLLYLSIVKFQKFLYRKSRILEGGGEVNSNKTTAQNMKFSTKDFFDKCAKSAGHFCNNSYMHPCKLVFVSFIVFCFICQLKLLLPLSLSAA